MDETRGGRGGGRRRRRRRTTTLRRRAPRDGDRAARAPRDPRPARAGGDGRWSRATASSTTRLAAMAYDDRPLPIGYGQTISQPYMVARATELAEVHADRSRAGGRRRLRVSGGRAGASSCAEVFAIEIVPALGRARAPRARRARRSRNVTLESFDGGGGWPAHAPYDVIIVSAGAPRVPPLLAAELADGGRLVIPLGGPEEQTLALVRRDRRRLHDLLRHALPIRRSPRPVRCRWRRAGGLVPVSGGASAVAGPSPAPACCFCRDVTARGRRCIPRTRPATGTWSRRARRWTLIAQRAGVPAEDILELNGLERADEVKPGTLLFVLTGTAAPERRRRRRRRPRPRPTAGRAPALRWPLDDEPHRRRLAVRRARGSRTRGSICRRRSARRCSPRPTARWSTPGTASAATAT